MHRKLLIPPVSAAAPGALYEQIVEGFKKEISAGRLPGGSPLPSFRLLAEDLMVSVITVKRAYEELERAGMIFRKQGLGTFVAEAGENAGREAKKQKAAELLKMAVKEALEAGLTSREINELLKQLLAEQKDENK